MRVSLLLVFAGLCALSGAFTVQDPHFAIHSVIPMFEGSGITFNPQGDLFLYDNKHFRSHTPNGCLFKFPSAANTPNLATIPFTYNPAGCAASGGWPIALGPAGTSGNPISIISTDTGRLYSSSGYEISPIDGSILRKAFNSCAVQGNFGLARDPRDGALFWSNYFAADRNGSRYVYRIENPDVHPEEQNTCSTPFANPGLDADTGVDGLTIGPDGIVYMAGYDSAAFLVYSAYSPATPTGTLIAQTKTGGKVGSGPDGISICFADGVSFAITADSNAQIIHRFNLTGPGGAPAYAISPLVTNTGGYNDFTAVDPKGCIWGTTMVTPNTPGIWRLSNADGSCMTCTVPQSNTVQGCSCDKQISIPSGSASSSVSSSGKCLALHFE